MCNLMAKLHESTEDKISTVSIHFIRFYLGNKIRQIRLKFNINSIFKYVNGHYKAKIGKIHNTSRKKIMAHLPNFE